MKEGIPDLPLGRKECNYMIQKQFYRRHLLFYRRPYQDYRRPRNLKKY